VPQLVWLSEHKGTVFAVAGALLVLSGAALWFGRTAPCPADPRAALACKRLRSLSTWLYSIAVDAFAAGAIFAFLLPGLAS